MQDYPGKFIVLEGSDGSGKGTQLKLLAERLKAVGHDVEIFDFPRYDQPSSHFVRRYLNGDYGPASEISPYSASMFYALDRYEAAPLINKALRAGKIVLSNRYVGSNMAHQGGKFSSEAEQRGFFIWADSLEFQLLGIPRPNLNIFLRVPAEISFELISQKAKREYTDKTHDEHEADINHLTRSIATYDTLCRLFPKDFVPIDCTRDGRLMSIPDISDLIWQTIQPLLPEKTAHKPREGIARLDTTIASTPETKSCRVSLLALMEIARSGVELAKPARLEWLQPNTDYSFYTPPQLDESSRSEFIEAIQSLVEAQRRMKARTAKVDSAQVQALLSQVIPLAAHASLELSQKDLEAVAKTSRLGEIKSLAGAPKAGAGQKDELTSLAQDKLPTSLSLELEPLTLLEAWPRNEFEILSDSLYGFSDLPRQEVQSAVEAWTYDQKYQAMGKILASHDSGAANQVRYRWDVIANQNLLIELISAGYAQNLRVQAPTPRYGYDVPETLAEMGIEDDFIGCFDESLRLYSKLQSSKQPELAAYAVLTGHKVRFEFTTDLASLVRPHSSIAPLLTGFLSLINEKIAEVHPVIGDFLAKNSQRTPSPERKPSAAKSKRRRRRSK
jgi:dTMP kinase